MSRRVVQLLVAVSAVLAFLAPAGAQAQPRGGGFRGAAPDRGFARGGFQRGGFERGGFGRSPYGPPPRAYGGRAGGYGRFGYPAPNPAPYPPPAYPPAAAPGGGYGGRFGSGQFSGDRFGGDRFGGDWRAQQDEVRQAVREGRHVPLGQAIDAVRRRTPGRELDADLMPGPNGRAVYRLRWAAANGRRMDYLVDAATGAVVGVEGGR